MVEAMLFWGLGGNGGQMSNGGPRASGLDAAVGGLAADLALVTRDLLVYHALFQAEWWGALARLSGDAEEARVLGEMHREADAEAGRTVAAMQAWGRTPAPGDDVGARLHVRMLADLLYVKESTTEALLLAGMRAPTAALRLEFVRLADANRRHADALRGLLGTRSVASLQRDGRAGTEAAGAYEGRADAPSFSHRIRRAVEDLRADGQEPCGLVLSPIALRHARDEGLLGPEDGTALGLPVEVDFGWRGECFCVQTRERATLAELIAERSQRPS